MNKVILLIAIVGFASAFRAGTLSNLWSAWKIQHKKTYTSAEEIIRFGIFVENLNKVSRLNSENTDAKFALNKFADLTATEFKLKHATGGF